MDNNKVMDNNKKIIIVEDLSIVAMAFKSFLHNHGLTNTEIFTNGKDAIESISHNKPDLALLDIRLKDEVSGIEIAARLQELNIPFIFISAFSDPDNLTKAENLHPAKIFNKPVNMSSVLKEVNLILNKAEA